MRVTANAEGFGAIVTGIDLAREALAHAEPLRAAFLQHAVLSFPDQALSDADLERFTLIFGPFGEDPFIAPIPGHPHILEVRREADETTPLFADTWHSDWSFLAVPPAATILYGLEIPPVGGDTWFADQQRAYAALDAATQADIATLHGLHSARRGYSKEGLYGEKDVGRSMDIRPSDAANAKQAHPIVRPHAETGAPVLFVNMGYTEAIAAMPTEQGWSLLTRLFAHQIQEAFILRQAWSPGHLVMWDNRRVIHRATGGYEGHRRVLHRTTVAGP